MYYFRKEKQSVSLKWREIRNKPRKLTEQGRINYKTWKDDKRHEKLLKYKPMKYKLLKYKIPVIQTP